MFCLLILLLLLSLINNDDHVLAGKIGYRREMRPSVNPIANTSTVSSFIHAHTSSLASASTSMVDTSCSNMADSALPTPLFDPENYCDIKSGTCEIRDAYCWFKDNNGTVQKANATDLDDLCSLWDPSCSGNRTSAVDKFFNTDFQSDLLENKCFSPADSINSVNTSDCDIYNPLERKSDFKKLRDWMRSKECESAATKWGATNGGDPRGFLAEFGPDNQFTPGITQSCCGVCEIVAESVDLYYWPESDADTSCLSIIGDHVNPLGYGATTEAGNVATTYWGCNVKTSYDEDGRNITTTSAVTTAIITNIGSLLVKAPLYNPWSSSPCLESDVNSKESNSSTEIRDKHARVQARDHTLLIPSSANKDNLLVTTVVSGNITL